MSEKKTTSKSTKSKSTTKDKTVKADDKKPKVVGTTKKKAAKKPMPTIMKIILAAAGGVVVLVIVLLVITSNATKGAATASDAFLNALQAGDGATAYSLLSSSVKENATEDEFSAFVSQVGPILNTEEKKLSQSVANSDDSPATGEVIYEIEGTDGVKYTISVQTVKEDDQWKVSYFDSNTDDNVDTE